MIAATLVSDVPKTLREEQQDCGDGKELDEGGSSVPQS